MVWLGLGRLESEGFSFKGLETEQFQTSEGKNWSQAFLTVPNPDGKPVL
jgi:hypothetical protein